MISLESLAQRAKATVASNARARAAKSSILRSSASEEPSPDDALAAELLERQNWRVEALVCRMERWVCQCGGTGVQPGGLFTLLVHTRLADSTRLIALRDPTQEDMARPKRLLYVEVPCAMCPACVFASGFRSLYTQPAVEPTPGEFLAEWRRRRNLQEVQS